MYFSYLASAYHDELIYSRLARTRIHLGLSNRNFFQSLFENKNRLINFHFGSHLTTIQKAFGTDFFDISQSVLKNSMFPFVSSFISPKASQLLRHNIVNGIYYTPAALIYLDYKYCPVCSKNDRTVLGETYWRRAFAVSCWDVCHEHGCYLMRIPVKGRNSGQLHCADDLIPTSFTKPISASKDEFNLAKIIFSIVNGDEIFSIDNLVSDLKDRKLIYNNKFDKVFCSERAKFIRSMPNALVDLVDKTLAFPSKSLLDPNRFSIYDPAVLILTKYFLESRNVQASSLKVKVCQLNNCMSCAKSNGLQIFQKYTGSIITQIVFCSNCEFTYYAAEANKSCRIIDFGTILPGIVSNLIKGGFTLSEIARRLNFSLPRIVAIRDKRFKRNFITKLVQKRDMIRSKFKKLSHRPFTQRSREYSWLTQYDREWLFSQPRPNMHSRWKR